MDSRISTARISAQNWAKTRITVRQKSSTKERRMQETEIKMENEFREGGGGSEEGAAVGSQAKCVL